MVMGYPTLGHGPILAGLTLLGLASSAMDEVCTKKKTVTIAPGIEMPWISFGGIVPDDLSSHAVVFEGGAHVRHAWKLLGLDTAMNYGQANQAELEQLLSSLPIDGISGSEVFLTHKIECGSKRCPKGMSEEQCFIKRIGLAATQIVDAAASVPTTIDLLLLHAPCNAGQGGADATHAIWRALEAAVPAPSGGGTVQQQERVDDGLETRLRAYYSETNVTGRIRSIGLSNFDADQIDELLTRPGLRVRPALVQNGYSAVKAGHPERGGWGGRDVRAFRKCTAERITFCAYSPLGEWTGVDVLNDPAVREVAEAHNKSTAQVAIKWLVQQGIPVVTATGSAAHAASDLDIFDFALTDEEMAAL